MNEKTYFKLIENYLNASCVDGEDLTGDCELDGMIEAIVILYQRNVFSISTKEELLEYISERVEKIDDVVPPTKH